MDLDRMPIFSALTRRMDWLSERQRVIAQNIANADTPGYRPQELKPLSFRELVAREGAPGGRMAPVQTSEGHIKGGATQVRHRVETQRQTYETAPSGNAVVLEEQLVKMAETQLEFSTAANLYRKHVGLLKLALGRRG
ncbi:MAG: flagellar basal body rod protein FlgB [Alphaproteobacteria bacterium]|nr:flagellar basal body rod protein FlgB [Alphaproteobacteria bacterium]